MRRHDEQSGDLITHVVETPRGTLTERVRITPNSWYRIEEKRWIETPEDMRAYTWLEDNSTWEWDQAAWDRQYAEWGRMGAPTMFMPRVNVQNLYINTMGVEPAVWALYEWGSVVEDYFRALHENHLRLIEVINASPVQIINFGDNLHCATLSPPLYEKYVLPAYRSGAPGCIGAASSYTRTGTATRSRCFGSPGYPDSTESRPSLRCRRGT